MELAAWKLYLPFANDVGLWGIGCCNESIDTVLMCISWWFYRHNDIHRFEKFKNNFYQWSEPVNVFPYEVVTASKPHRILNWDSPEVYLWNTWMETLKQPVMMTMVSRRRSKWTGYILGEMNDTFILGGEKLGSDANCLYSMALFKGTGDMYIKVHGGRTGPAP